jgi:hypothetical protein
VPASICYASVCSIRPDQPVPNATQGHSTALPNVRQNPNNSTSYRLGDGAGLRAGEAHNADAAAPARVGSRFATIVSPYFRGQEASDEVSQTYPNAGTGPLPLWELVLADNAEAEFIEAAVS